MCDLKLRPEHDFIENSDYLFGLVGRLDKYDSSDKELMQEVLQADYYVNKLVRRGCSNSNELLEMSTLFKGVLDTVESKEVLSLHKESTEEEVKDSVPMYIKLLDMFFTLVLIISVIVILVTIRICRDDILSLINSMVSWVVNS